MFSLVSVCFMLTGLLKNNWSNLY